MCRTQTGLRRCFWPVRRPWRADRPRCSNRCRKWTRPGRLFEVRSCCVRTVLSGADADIRPCRAGPISSVCQEFPIINRYLLVHDGHSAIYTVGQCGLTSTSAVQTAHGKPALLQLGLCTHFMSGQPADELSTKVVWRSRSQSCEDSVQ